MTDRRVDVDSNAQLLARTIQAARLTDRSIDERIGICRGVLLDGAAVASERKAFSNFARQRRMRPDEPECLATFASFNWPDLSMTRVLRQLRELSAGAKDVQVELAFIFVLTVVPLLYEPSLGLRDLVHLVVTTALFVAFLRRRGTSGKVAMAALGCAIFGGTILLILTRPSEAVAHGAFLAALLVVMDAFIYALYVGKVWAILWLVAWQPFTAVLLGPPLVLWFVHSLGRDDPSHVGTSRNSWIPTSYLVAFAVTYLLAILATTGRRPSVGRAIGFTTAAIAGAWILGSAADFAVLAAGLNPRPEISTRMSSEEESASHSTSADVAIALSGGGYRAALLHAGVLEALGEMGIRPRAITSVSGGSIVGAYAAMGGSPEMFVGTVASGELDLKREALNAFNFIRYFAEAFPGSLFRYMPSVSTTSVQASMLDRMIFGGARMKDLGAQSPAIMFATTDLRTGRNVGITAAGVIEIPLRPVVARLASPQAREVYCRTLNLDDERLANLVAASGAFPGFFAPYSPSAAKDLVLVDGGVSDNLGISLTVSAVEIARSPAKSSSDDEEKCLTASWLKPWDVDLIVASDGGTPLSVDWRVESSGNLLGPLSRSIDLIHAQTGTLREASLFAGRADLIVISPTNPFADPDSCPPAWSRKRMNCLLGDTAMKRLVKEVHDSLSKECVERALAILDSPPVEFQKDGCELLKPPTDLFSATEPADRLLFERVWDELLQPVYRRIAIFQSQPTLDDTVAESTATEIFALGKDLTWLQERELIASLPRSKRRTTDNQ